MSSPAGLLNLGPKSTAMLASIGIATQDDLRRVGAVPAFLRLKESGAAVSLNLLWAMEGALTGRHWREVARDDRLRLLTEIDDFSRRSL